MRALSGNNYMNILRQRETPLLLTALSLTVSTLLALSTRAADNSAETLERVAKEAYAKFKQDNRGKNADYIPALAKVPTNLFGISIITVDGKIITVGDVDYPFSIQSCSKVFTM